jgi:hypothetical protein
MPAQLAADRNTGKRQKMIEYSLQEKAPKTYRELKKNGSLLKYVQEVDKELLDLFEDLDVKYFRAQPKGVGALEAIQNRNESLRRAWEEACQVCLDFADPAEPTTESTPET